MSIGLLLNFYESQRKHSASVNKLMFMRRGSPSKVTPQVYAMVHKYIRTWRDFWGDWLCLCYGNVSFVLGFSF